MKNFGNLQCERQAESVSRNDLVESTSSFTATNQKLSNEKKISTTKHTQHLFYYCDDMFFFLL